jgi:ferredoxin-fold anticodon binding domain-containing protein
MDFILMDLERTLGSGVPAYWKSNKRGYSYNIHEAGLYSEEEAKKMVKEDIDKRTVQISVKTVEDILSIKLR